MRAFLTFDWFDQEDAVRFLENLKLIKLAGSFGDCCTIVDMSGASDEFLKGQGQGQQLDVGTQNNQA